MKVKDLDVGSVVYIHNKMFNSFSELELVEHKDDDITRFHLTGSDFCDLPEDGVFLPTLDLVSVAAEDGSIYLYAEAINKLPAVLWRFERFIKNLFGRFAGVVE